MGPETGLPKFSFLPKKKRWKYLFFGSEIIALAALNWDLK